MPSSPIRCKISCLCTTRCRWWKTSEINEAIALAHEGLSANRIAKALNNGKSRQAVAALLRSKGIRTNGEDGPPYGNRNRQGLPPRPATHAPTSPFRQSTLLHGE